MKCKQCNKEALSTGDLCQECWDKSHGIVGRIFKHSRKHEVYLCSRCGKTTFSKTKLCRRDSCVAARPKDVCYKCKKPSEYLFKGMCRTCIKFSKKALHSTPADETAPEAIRSYLIEHKDDN